MPSRHVEIWARRSCFRCQAGSGGDRNNCGTRNWSTAGHKRRKRKICCFYKDEFISRRDVEHLSLIEVSCTELNRFSHLRAHYVIHLCLPFSKFPYSVYLYPSLIRFFFSLDCFFCSSNISTLHDQKIHLTLK